MGFLRKNVNLSAYLVGIASGVTQGKGKTTEFNMISFHYL